MDKVPNDVETLPKNSTGCSRAHEHYRQTDGQHNNSSCSPKMQKQNN